MKGSFIRVAAVWPLFVFVAFLVLAGCASEVLALDDETTSQSLTGLKGISVMVPPITPDPEPDGLKRDQIQTYVEMKLRKAGVKLATDRELAKHDFPYLSININAVKGKNSESYNYNISVELYKQVIQNPQDEIDTAMQTISIKIWSSGLTGTIPGSDLKNNVQKDVDNLTDEFIKAYLAANPKE